MNRLDRLLFVGGNNSRLQQVSRRIGYDVAVEERAALLELVTQGAPADLIIVEDDELQGPDLCAFLRANELTKEVPILYLYKSEREARAVRDMALPQLDLEPASESVGVLAGRIATRLRLRKLDGSEDPRASLGAVNAALRDLTTRLKKELEEARAIQESLLPRVLPRDDRFEVACFYQPLDEVGGDWYFVEEEASGAITLQVADVTGHGLAAAFIGSMTRLALKAAAVEEPGRRLAEINRLMTPQLPEGRFVTMLSCLYDPASGRLAVARAGHLPPLLIRPATATVDEIDASGFPVGFTDDSVYHTTSAQLAVGDAVVLYTDGLVEAMSRSNEQFGVARVKEALLGAADTASVEEMLQNLLSQFNQFRDGRRLRDDVTVVLLRRVA